MTQDRSQSETAYQKIYDAVKEGTFLPGQRLREEYLAERFKISRTPIREAIRILESEGIVVHRPRLGAVIKELSYAEVIELYEMRRIIERSAAELAARHATEAEVDELRDLNNSISQSCHDSAHASSINQDFHRCLYWAARNRYLLQSSKLLNHAMMLLGRTTLVDPHRIEEVYQQHQDIINAIALHEPAQAGAAAVIHLETSLRFRLKGLRT